MAAKFKGRAKKRVAKQFWFVLPKTIWTLQIASGDAETILNTISSKTIPFNNFREHKTNAPTYFQNIGLYHWQQNMNFYNSEVSAG